MGESERSVTERLKVRHMRVEEEEILDADDLGPISQRVVDLFGVNPRIVGIDIIMAGGERHQYLHGDGTQSAENGLPWRADEEALG